MITFHKHDGRRKVEKFIKLSKMSNLLNFLTIICNHHGKYIQISTNIPCIGLVIREIAVEILTNLRKQTNILYGMVSVKNHENGYRLSRFFSIVYKIMIERKNASLLKKI